MDEEETRFVIGHELGHVLSGHSVYRTMLFHLVNLAARHALVPFAGIGLKAVIWGLEEWFAASRSCPGGPGPGCWPPRTSGGGRGGALMKTAGGSRLVRAEQRTPSTGAGQGVRRGAGHPARDRLKLLQLQGTTRTCVRHGPVRLRASWTGGPTEGEYRDILAGRYPRREEDSDTSVGDEFKAAAKSYQDSWNRSADPLIGVARGTPRAPAARPTALFSRFGGGGSGSDRWRGGGRSGQDD